MRSLRAFDPSTGSGPKRVCCAVAKCRTAVERGKMMCLTHWLLVPAPLRTEIQHTYRARQMRNYQDAYARAVDHVEGATGVFTGILETRANCDPARAEGGGLDPFTPPSTLRQAQGKPIGMRVRRPRLTEKRLKAIEEALLFRRDGACGSDVDWSDATDGALLWVSGER